MLMPFKTGEDIWREIIQIQRRPVHENNEYDLRLPLLKLLEELFLTDIRYAFEKKADVMFFTVQKESLEQLKNQFEKKGLPQTAIEKVNYTSALNQCFCELVELGLLVQERYAFVIDHIPAPFIFSPDVLQSGRSAEVIAELDQPLRCKFINFVCLRLGDISRYLLDYDTSKTFYKRAVEALPTDGQAYNQIGLIETAEHKSIESLYEHALAVNTLEPFAPAAANIENIYKKFSSINMDDRRLSYDALFINFVGVCHSLLENSEKYVERLSLLLRAEKVHLIRLKMHFIILVSVWISMVSSTDEIKCADCITAVVADQFFFLIHGYIEKDYPDDEKNDVLSSMWVYASWLDEKKISLARRASKDIPWIKLVAQFLDILKAGLDFDNKIQHLQYFCPLSSFNFQCVNGSNFYTRVKSIFQRILRFYRIADTPSENFVAYYQNNQELFVEKRRVRTSHTVPILASL